MAVDIRQHHISEGPSKFNLMLSVFEGKTVSFTVVQDGRNLGYSGKYFSIQAEDGSNESWNLTGHLYLAGSRIGMHFKAYFDSRTRKGWLRFV